ncbi:hypothetical protein AX16_005097 [Volvariella volvacea WC 439]|nr:hypothetical protein AX16_005097 [Volvariella volvacea WC 439]
MATPAQPQLVLVTGISGYLGSNVAFQLLKAGYAVRGYRDPSFAEKQLTNVSILPTSVYAVIHVATPRVDGGGSASMVKKGIEGTLHTLNQAYKAGVKKFVLTSSFAATVDPDFQVMFTDRVLTEKVEEALAGEHNDMWLYVASKVFAEKAALRFAAERPDFDLAIVLPTSLYGPYPPHFAFPRPDAPTTSSFVYMLLLGQIPPVLTLNCHDVRDSALAHLRALELPHIERDAATEATVEDIMAKLEERRIIASGGIFTWDQAVEDRLPAVPEESYDIQGSKNGELKEKKLTPVARADNTRARELLGMDEWIGWKESLDATVEWLLESEKLWKERDGVTN